MLDFPILISFLLQKHLDLFFHVGDDNMYYLKYQGFPRVHLLILQTKTRQSYL